MQALAARPRIGDMKHSTLYTVLAAAMVAALAVGCQESAPPGGEDDFKPKGLRILSLTPNVTEILFSLGLGNSIVGRSTHCDFPKEARTIPAVGDTLHLNLERIVSLEPTVAFIVTKRADVVRTIEGLGIRTVALESDTMDELMETIDVIGRETGRTAPAKTLREDIQHELRAVRRLVEGRPRPKVLFAFPMTVGSPNMMVAGRGTFVDELLNVAGGENAFPETADWPTITPQRAIQLAPEVVIINAVGKDAAPDRLKAISQAWLNWTSIPAVANSRVYILQDEFLTIPGPTVGLAAERLARVIHRGGPRGIRPIRERNRP